MNDHDEYRQLDHEDIQRAMRLHPANRIELLILSIIQCNPKILAAPSAMFKTARAMSRVMSHRQRCAVIEMCRDTADEIEHELLENQVGAST